MGTSANRALPLRDNTLDFVYTIGVLHHLAGSEEQQAAAAEVARVLKPGGLWIIHETNPRNPLFRFYMSYLFPILKTIDMGTEFWIDPHHWTAVPGLKLAAIQYFTFLPDFLPRSLIRPFLALERRLESSSLRSYSVHYVATQPKPSCPPRPHVETARPAMAIAL